MASVTAFHEDRDHVSLVDAAPVAMIMLDPGGLISLVNQEAEALFGYDRGELLGRHVELLVPESLRDAHPQHRNDYLQAPEPRRMGLGRRLYALHKDGTQIPVEIGLRPLMTQDGVCVVSTIVDITERIRSDQARARLAAIVEFSHVAMFALTVDGIVTDWNPAAEALYGYSADEIIGQSVLCLTPRDLLDESAVIIRRATSGGVVDDLETDRLHKTGKRVRVSLTVSPMKAPDGSIFGISSIARDITERVRLEEELQARAEQLMQANASLEESNLELKQFAYVASHDLQAPLRGINGFLELLSNEYADQLDSQARDWIEIVLNSCGKLQTLIRDLLSYARLESRAQPFGPVELSEVFDEVVHLLSVVIEESGATVTRDSLPTVLGDASQLARVFENLIENALKYRGTESPLVQAGATEEDACWRLSVRDNGLGIDPQFHERIFEIFRRLHGDAEYSGTGIGLAICRRVIMRHGGRLWVESSEGEGSTFHFTLPKA